MVSFHAPSSVSHLALAVALAAVGCGGGGGSGQPAQAPNRAFGTADADHCSIKGRAELDAKHWIDAEAKLGMAWSIDGRAELAADLGRAELELGKIGPAAVHLQVAIDGGVNAAGALLASIRGKLASIALKPPSVSGDVAIFVDGWRATHRLPKGELWLAVGRHEVELHVGARIVARKTFDLALGKHVEWDAAVDGKVDLPVVVGPGLGAGVGVGVGTVGAALPAVGAAAGGGLAVGSGVVNASLDAKANVQAQASGALSVPLIVAGSLVGVTAIVVGTAFAVAATNLSADAGKLMADLKVQANTEFPCTGSARQNNLAQCLAIEGKFKDQEIFLGVGIPVLVTAGLVVAGGLTYVFWPRAKAPDAKLEFCGVKVRPSVGPGALGVHGTF